MKQCADLMTKNPSTCTPKDTAQRAAQVMQMDDVGSIPIVGDDSMLLGIVTDRDLALHVVAGGLDPASVTLDAIMTRNPVTCRLDDDVEEAMRAMAGYQVRRVPVVTANGILIGIISQADIATRIDDPEATAAVVEVISEPG